MIFRQANVADIPAIMDVRLSVKQNVLSNPEKITYQMYEDYLDKLGQGWVCEIDGKVVGFSYAIRTEHSIWALFVYPQFEGRGIGKRLLTLATDWLFESGAEKVVLATEANTQADKFYESQGWERGEMKDNIEVYYSLWRSIEV
jgi:GNAT superfamily N-acetyltransferase